MSANLPMRWNPDRQDREAEAREGWVMQARDELRREMVAAMTAGAAQRIVPAPGYSGEWTLEECLRYDLADPECTLLAELIAVCGLAARSGDPVAIGAIAKVAERHATFHADDLAREMRQEAIEAAEAGREQ